MGNKIKNKITKYWLLKCEISKNEIRTKHFSYEPTDKDIELFVENNSINYGTITVIPMWCVELEHKKI